MSTFVRILSFELGYYARRISTHVYFGIFFALSALVMLSMGGGLANYFDTGNGGWVGWANSAYTMSWIVPVFSLFGLLVTAPLLGRAVQRDYAHQMHPLIFSQPISRHAYLGGRFTGAVLANAYVFAAVPLGMMLASLLPVMEPDRMGPFRLANFVAPYLVVMLPNLLFTAAIFFVLAAHTRRMLPNYVGGVALMVGYSIATNMIGDVENVVLAGLLDPLSLTTLESVTRYWTVLEQNTLPFPSGGLVLLNRVVWLSFGALVLAIGWWRFRFVEVKEGGRKTRAGVLTAPPDLGAATPLRALPIVGRSFRLRSRVRQYLSVTRVAFLGIVRDVYFYALTAAGVLMVLPSVRFVGVSYGTGVQPATYRVLETMSDQFGIFVVVVAALYAGELVWRDRDLRANQIADSMPVPTGILLGAKLTALAGALALMLAVLIPLGIVTQAAYGYFRFQIGLYLSTIFGMRLLQYLLFGALALGVHSVLNHKYLAHFVVIVGVVISGFFDAFGLEHVLYTFASDAGETYSEMLGYGSQLAPFFWLKAYWAGWVILLLVAGHLLWVRGEDTGLRIRLRVARSRAGRGHGFATLGALVLILGAGGFVFYNTNILNEYLPERASQRRSAEYERTYRRLADVVQPSVTSTELAVDLYPSERRGEVSATHRMENRSDRAVDTLHLFFTREPEVMELEVTGARPGRVDLLHGYRPYVFDPPLAPGDSAMLRYVMSLRHRGFANTEGDFPIRESGTLLQGGPLGPSIGYSRLREVSGEDARRRNELPPRKGASERDAPGAVMQSLFGTEGGREFSATISTDAGQVAVAPGELVSHWSQDGRNYFRYQARHPILLYAVTSGRWTETRDRWGDIDIVVYHHPTHGQNVGRMIQAVRETLEYCTSRFGPYPFSRVSILELPRTGMGGGGAQALPGMIPYWEDAGFSARVREGDIDTPFYVTAHEVGHFWWGHQLVPAETQGARVLTEALTQYTALMVMKHHYGRDRVRRFLRYELDRYLTGRAREGRGETPLAVSQRGYGVYQKGSVVMFALQERLGEEQVNRVLRDLLNEALDESPPFPTTLDLLRLLREVTPDSVLGSLEDAFDRIVLYENQVTEAEATPLEDGRYALRVVTQTRKMVADSTGLETDVPMEDLLDLVVYGERSVPGEDTPVLRAVRYHFTGGESTIDVEVEGKPARVILDPFYTVVDRTPEDNERRVVMREVRGAGS